MNPHFQSDRSRNRISCGPRLRLAALLAAGFIALASPRPAPAFFVYVNSISGPPVHENITREGLAFLTFDARESAVTGVWFRDVSTGVGSPPDDAKYHFDDCEFKETIGQTINPLYALMLNMAAQGKEFAASGGGGDLWLGIGLDSFDVSNIMFNFGLMLHAAQDLYSHSDWAELRQQGFVQERIFDTGRGYWWEPPGDWSVHPAQTNLVVAEGNGSTLPAGWTVSYEKGTWDETPAGKTMRITTTATTMRGLVTGRYHGGDADSHSHETVHWNHSDDAHGDASKYGTQYGLNKDRGDWTQSSFYPARLLFPQAAELAILQTAQEWKRFMALWRATLGDASASARERQAVNFKTDVYVDNTLWLTGTHFDQYSLGLHFYPDRTYYQPGNGDSGAPFHYIPVAENAAEPNGAVMHIKPTGTDYVGAQRIGTAGRRLRLEVRPGYAGTVRLVK